MRQKLISAESSEPVTTVWQRLSKAEQQLAIDLPRNTFSQETHSEIDTTLLGVVQAWGCF